MFRLTTTADFANGIAILVATTAPKDDACGARGWRLTAPVSSRPIARERAVAQQRKICPRNRVEIEIVNRGDKVLLYLFAGMTVTIKSVGDSFMIDDGSRVVRSRVGRKLAQIGWHAIRENAAEQARPEPGPLGRPYRRVRLGS